MKTKISLLTAALTALAIAFTFSSCAQFKAASKAVSGVSAPSSLAVQKTILAGCDVIDAAMPWVAKGLRSGVIPRTGPARVGIDKAIQYATPVCLAGSIPSSMTDVALAELFHAGATLAAASATVQASK